jgi:GNAT superfamily N-acetyltransferase
MTSLEIVRRRPEHDPELFELYAEVFGEGNLQRSRRRYDWQYFENPNTPPDGPVIWMAREGGILLGQMATMPFPMWWGDREVKASAGNDYFVRKSAQGRGIGIALSNRWADEVDVALALGLTPSSYPLFRKIFTDVGPVPSFLKILDANAVARRKWGAVGGAIAGPLLGLGLSLISRRTSPPSEIEVRPVQAFSDEYDDLWMKARASYTTCVRRDARYLRWKYLACPFREYRVLEARKADALMGYAVLREEGDASFRRGVIADLFCDTKDLATQDGLIAAAVEDFSTKRLARIEVYCFNSRLAAALKRHGFRSGTTGVQYCVAYRGTADGKGGAKTVLTNLPNWNLFIGDGDLDRA